VLPEHKLNFSLCAPGPWEGPIGIKRAVVSILSNVTLDRIEKHSGLGKLLNTSHKAGAWIRPGTGIDNKHNPVSVHQSSARFVPRFVRMFSPKSRENGAIHPEHIGVGWSP
jgi:hypothetical protein